jgi:alpha-beta hydrolase superfamily lysophospholipase
MIWFKRVWHLCRWLLVIIGVCALAITVLTAAPLSRPPELASIHAGAAAIDQSGLPDLSRFQARDGTTLAYRIYPAADGDTQKIAIIIHGSAGHSANMNEIAKRLAAKSFVAVSPDMRGHGASGTRGDIGYEGQLDDDLQDLLTELRKQYPQAHFALLGFSAGGGFALRAASGKLAGDFDRLVLLSPYLGYDAPSSRSSQGSARWADADIPRIIALIALRRLGLECCESLPVIAFALPPDIAKYATAEYSFRLLSNFAAPRDLDAAFHRLKMPTTIIAGSADELMQSDKYADMVRGIEPAIDVKIVPGLGHMDMMHGPAAIDAISSAFGNK